MSIATAIRSPILCAVGLSMILIRHTELINKMHFFAACSRDKGSAVSPVTLENGLQFKMSYSVLI